MPRKHKFFWKHRTDNTREHLKFRWQNKKCSVYLQKDNKLSTTVSYIKKISIEEIVLPRNIHNTFNLAKILRFFFPATSTFQGQTHWWLNYFFHKIKLQIIGSYPISSQLHVQPNPFRKFSWKCFAFALGLCGKVLVAEMATSWPLWETARTFSHVWKTQCQPNSREISTGQGWDHRWQWWYLQGSIAKRGKERSAYQEL